MKYPKYSTDLVQILHEDQQDIISFTRKNSRNKQPASLNELNLRCRMRAEAMLKILDQIKDPTIGNVGQAGSQAISIMALHSNLSIMRRVLYAFEQAYKDKADSVFNEAIPTLTDRVAILEQQKQLFGTQWFKGEDGKFYMYPVDDFKTMETRRKEFGLGKARFPIDLAKPGAETERVSKVVKPGDQGSPSKEEYSRYVGQFLD